MELAIQWGRQALIHIQTTNSSGCRGERYRELGNTRRRAHLGGEFQGELHWDVTSETKVERAFASLGISFLTEEGRYRAEG